MKVNECKVHVLFTLTWNSSDTKAPMVYSLTLNNEGRMDKDTTHTTEWFPPSS